MSGPDEHGSLRVNPALRQVIDRNNPAPGRVAGEFGMILTEQLRAHRRMNPVAADQQISAHRSASVEVGGDLIGRFRQLGKCVTQVNTVRVIRANRVDQSIVQIRTVDLVIRGAELAHRLFTVGDVHHDASVPIVLDRANGRRAGELLEHRPETKVLQNNRPIGGDREPRAQLTQFGGRFIDGYPKARFLQRQGRGQTADSGPDDNDADIFHQCEDS